MAIKRNLFPISTTLTTINNNFGYSYRNVTTSKLIFNIIILHGISFYQCTFYCSSIFFYILEVKYFFRISFYEFLNLIFQILSFFIIIFRRCLNKMEFIHELNKISDDIEITIDMQVSCKLSNLSNLADITLTEHNSVLTFYNIRAY